MDDRDNIEYREMLIMFKKQLRRAIRQNSLTQNNLAEELKTGQPAVNNWLSVKITRGLPNVIKFFQICRILKRNPLFFTKKSLDDIYLENTEVLKLLGTGLKNINSSIGCLYGNVSIGKSRALGELEKKMLPVRIIDVCNLNKYDSVIERVSGIYHIDSSAGFFPIIKESNKKLVFDNADYLGLETIKNIIDNFYINYKIPMDFCGSFILKNRMQRLNMTDINFTFLYLTDYDISNYYRKIFNDITDNTLDILVTTGYNTFWQIKLFIQEINDIMKESDSEELNNHIILMANNNVSRKIGGIYEEKSIDNRGR